MKTARFERRSKNPGTSTLTDEQLLFAYCETGCNQSFATLVQRYKRQLYVFLRSILQDESLTEDVLQATFLQLHRKCKQFEPERKLRPWLYAIARNKAIDVTRREKKHTRQSIDETRYDEEESSLAQGIPADEPGPYDECVAQERAQSLWAAVGGLPDRLRLAIQLVHFEGLMYREAAAALAIPVGTLKSRLHTATKQLEQVLVLQHSGLVPAQ